MRACCTPANMTLVAEWMHEGFGRTHHRCRVCGANHYGMEAEPIRFGVQGAPINEAPKKQPLVSYRVSLTG